MELVHFPPKEQFSLEEHFFGEALLQQQGDFPHKQVVFWSRFQNRIVDLFHSYKNNRFSQDSSKQPASVW